MIIDSHTHLSRMSDEETFQSAFNKLISELKTNDVSKAVVIADNVSNPWCADMDILIENIAHNPQFFMIGSLYPINQPQDQSNKFDKLLTDKKIIGLKIFPGHDKVTPLDNGYISTYELALKHRVPVIVHTGANSGDPQAAEYNDPKYIVEVANKYPQLNFVISHYFWPKIEYCFNTTQGIKNIYFDTSGMADEEVLEASGGLPVMKDILERTIKRNPNSVLYGTDYPMCPMKEHIELIRSLDISDDLKKCIFSKNFIKLFNTK